ncbi:MAG: hypothetical protein JXK07_15985 [Spirochaetes bacterium]|nr:hypothetical protein [Spirochaetota bacterium]MBN2772019.1 hypothetical protein [Spirochaetota bacterium]
MKRFILLLLMSVVFSVMFSCDDEDEKGGEEVYSFFYDAASEVLPAYGASGRAVWSLGSPIYELYGILENDDDLMVGYFNIYDTLENADSRFTEAVSAGSEIKSGDLSLDYEYSNVMGESVYDTYMRYNSDGYVSDTYVKKAESKISMLNITVIDTDGELNKSFVEGVYDESTGDVAIEIFMSNYVDETGNTGWESVRAYFEGNTNDHVFKLKVIRDGVGYDHNIVGSGISQGDGYFLLKLADNSLDINDSFFYTINADADVEELKILDDAGKSTAAEAGDTEEYASSLLTAFTTDDLPADQDAAESLDITIEPPAVD